MRKLKISLLIIFIICLFNFTKVLAADASAILNVDKTTLKSGDTVTVTLNASCDEGLSYVGTKIEYDSNVLTLQNKTVANNWIDYGTDKLELFINTSNKTTNATVCTLVFKVNDNATEGTTTISTTPIEITDINNNEYTKPKLEKPLTIVREESNVGQGNEQQDNTESSEQPKEEKPQTQSKDTDGNIKGENKAQDKTTSNNKLPDTGRTNIIIGITFVILIIGIVLYFKNRKYKI